MITPTEVIFPKGRIHPDLLPDRNEMCLRSDVQEWIDEAYGKARVSALSASAKHEAARQWVYYRAFDAAFTGLVSNPATSAQTDAGSHSYARDQREAVARMRDEALAAFEKLAPDIAELPAVIRSGGQTVHHGFAW